MGHAIEQRVVKAVVRNRMAFGKLPPCQFRMGGGAAADEKKGREDAFPLERLKHCGGRAWLGTVIEGQHDFLVGERQAVGKVLAADPRGRGGMNRDHARRRKRIRVPRAGLLLGLSRRQPGGEQKRKQNGRQDVRRNNPHQHHLPRGDARLNMCGEWSVHAAGDGVLAGMWTFFDRRPLFDQ